MRRRMISISDRQDNALKSTADHLGISVSDVVRRILDDYEPLWRSEEGNDNANPNHNSRASGSQGGVALLSGGGRGNPAA